MDHGRVRCWSLLGTCVLLVGLAGCSGSEESPAPVPAGSSSPASPSASPSAATAPGVKSAAGARRTVRDYLDAFFGNRTEAACALMTQRYQDENIAAGADLGIAPGATCPEAMSVAVELAGAFDVDAASFTVGKATLDGDSASVAVSAKGDLRDNTYVVIWNGSGWLVDSDAV